MFLCFLLCSQRNKAVLTSYLCFILIATWSAWAWEILCTEFKRTNLLWKLWNYLRAISKPLQIFFAVIQMLEIKRMEWHLAHSAKTCLDYSFEHNHWKELPLVDYRILTRYLLSIKMHSYFMKVVPVQSLKVKKLYKAYYLKSHTKKPLYWPTISIPQSLFPTQDLFSPLS